MEPVIGNLNLQAPSLGRRFGLAPAGAGSSSIVGAMGVVGWGLPEIRAPLLRAAIKRIILVYWGLY